ncbi:hypothetical protein [Streptomyces griseorubiginosus]|uniref:hypothetical protein n=1 Tax=Streptomyces griseorubiginosus TaxID=67304 RepID=UPI003652715E
MTTTPHGALVVTGRAGAGKSALLGHILLHTRSQLRDILIRHGHLQPLPQGVVCPQDPFDVVAHLAGLTLARTVELIATAADLPDITRDAASGQPAVGLADRLITELHTRRTPLTLLLDALDEAEQPLTIADVLLRPLASLPTIRVIIGTRSSTHEGPDQPAPADTNLLEALGLLPPSAASQRANHVQCLEVIQDREAFAGYLRAKLSAAKLDVDDEQIADTVLLLAEHHNAGTEPQQFLYVRLAAHELLRDTNLITDPTPLIGLTHRQLFTRALDRLHQANPAYTPLLHALGLAQGRGIPDQDGIWALSAGALTSTPTGISDAIPQLLRDAAPYLALDQEYGQTVYRLAHRTFAEHFTNAPGSTKAHVNLCTALTQRAQQILDTPVGQTTVSVSPPDINPYIRYHLAGHARLGSPAGSFRTLADHPDALDTLDLTSVTAAVNHVPAHVLPPAVAGTVLLQHLAHSSPTSDEPALAVTAWRQWWRRLGTTYVQGTAPPAEAPVSSSTGPCATVVTASVQRRQLSLQLTGHTGAARALLVFAAADGTPRLATTGAEDQRVRIWNPATGRPDGDIDIGHLHRVQTMVGFATEDGTPRLATTGAGDQRVHIWDPATGRPDGDIHTGHPLGVRALVGFTAADGTPRLATTGAEDQRVRIWNPTTRRPDGDIHTGHPGGVHVMVGFTAADGTPRFATAAGADGSVRIWDPTTGLQDSDSHTGRASSVWALAGFTAGDGTPRLATTAEDQRVRIWNPATGRPDGDIDIGHTGHPGGARALVGFTAADGTPRLATTGAEGSVRIWDPTTGPRDSDTHTGHPGGARALVGFTAADGTPRLATIGANDQRVRIWDPATGRPDGDIHTGHPLEVRALAGFTAADGTPRLATTGADGTVRIWDPTTRGPDGTLHIAHPGGARALVGFTAADGTPRLATIGADDQRVRIWDPATGRELHIDRVHRVRAMPGFTAADGTPRLATANADGSVRIWDPATGEQDHDIHIERFHRVRAMVGFTAADGTPRLATAGADDQRVRIWNPTTGPQDSDIHIAHHGVRAMVGFTAADGTPRLATADDQRVYIWNPATGREDRALHIDRFHRVRSMVGFTAADGTPRLATTTEDQRVYVWNPATGREDRALHIDRFHRVRAMVGFTAADGTPRLATIGEDQKVHIWNLGARTSQTLPFDTAASGLATVHGLLVVGSAAGHFVLRMA